LSATEARTRRAPVSSINVGARLLSSVIAGSALLLFAGVVKRGEA
jgi:hypothetical protein